MSPSLKVCHWFDAHIYSYTDSRVDVHHRTRCDVAGHGPHAWVLSHSKHESQVAVLKFEKISQVTEVEKEKRTSPLSLSYFFCVIFDMSRSFVVGGGACLHLLHKFCVADPPSLLQNKLGTNTRTTWRICLSYEDCSGYVHWSRSMIVLLSVVFTDTVASPSFPI